MKNENTNYHLYSMVPWVRYVVMVMPYYVECFGMLYLVFNYVEKKENMSQFEDSFTCFII